METSEHILNDNNNINIIIIIKIKLYLPLNKLQPFLLSTNKQCAYRRRKALSERIAKCEQTLSIVDGLIYLEPRRKQPELARQRAPNVSFTESFTWSLLSSCLIDAVFAFPRRMVQTYGLCPQHRRGKGQS